MQVEIWYDIDMGYKLYAVSTTVSISMQKVAVFLYWYDMKYEDMGYNL